MKTYKSQTNGIQDELMDANAVTQDAESNVVALFSGIQIRKEIDSTEDALRLKLRTLTRELAKHCSDTTAQLIYRDIKNLWRLEDANEARENFMDCREAKLITALKGFVSKVIEKLRCATSLFESLKVAGRAGKVA